MGDGACSTSPRTNSRRCRRQHRRRSDAGRASRGVATMARCKRLLVVGAGAGPGAEPRAAAGKSHRTRRRSTRRRNPLRRILPAGRRPTTTCSAVRSCGRSRNCCKTSARITSCTDGTTAGRREPCQEFSDYVQADPNARNLVAAFDKRLDRHRPRPAAQRQPGARLREGTPTSSGTTGVVLMGDGSVKMMDESEFQAALEGQ